MDRTLLQTSAGRAVAAALGVIVLATLVGLAVLWPGGGAGVGALSVGEVEEAEVRGVERVECDLSRIGRCQRLTITVRSGPGEGTTTPLTLPSTNEAPEVAVGDRIRVVSNEVVPGLEGEGVEAYAFADFERRSPLLVLAVLFAVVVVAFGRWKGLRALAGLALSLVVVTQFLVPAILEGSAPVPTALVGALAVMLVTVFLAHGTGVTSVAAVLGSTAALLATALLAVLFVEAARITGFSSEEATLLRSASGADGSPGDALLSLEGLVLAGIVVGALGVLDDVTVSQASTVLALRRANPALPLARLITEAMSVGRDHLSATVNTLVLAYVGAALPILLIFESQGTTFGDAANREVVATEIVAMLVGSIGLVLAVPLTTTLAALLARRLPAEALPADAHHHQH